MSELFRCAERNARRTRVLLIVLVALLLPFQVLTALYLDIRGPLHFHIESHHDHDHAHVHAHDHLERHHHDAHDPTVIVVDGDAGQSVAGEAEAATGWSSVMFVTLPRDARLSLLNVSSVLVPTPEFPPQTVPRRRIERPPPSPVS